jgi:hypothetical protein
MPSQDAAGLRQQMLRRLALQPQADLISRLCCLATQSIPCHDAVVVLEARDGVNGPVAACGALGEQFANAEFELGEGPTFAVRVAGQYLYEDDIARHLPPTWPVLGARCHDLGIAAIASYPLHVGHAQLGALHALMTTPEPIGAHGHAAALTIANLLTDALLYLQSGLTEMDFIQLLDTSDSQRLRVHQATGMVSEMLRCSVSDAMAVMRAKAFETDITLYELSRRIVTREMRIEP